MSKPPHSQRGGQQQVSRKQPPVIKQVAVEKHWSGPLPAPVDIQGYESVIPGGAERILSMAEAEQRNRIALDARGMDAAIKESRRGQYLGALITLAAIAGAIYSVRAGASWYTVALFLSVPLLSLVKTIVNRSSNGDSKPGS